MAHPHFYNPVSVTFAEEISSGIRPLLKERRAAILTTRGMVQRKMLAPLEAVLGARLAGICTDVVSNPDAESILRCTAKISFFDPQLLVAMGGGSVLDTAKVVAVLLSMPAPQHWLPEFLAGKAVLPPDINPLPVIAIPTTSGTGSEVTPWCAIWDKKTGQKYSLDDPKMYPEAALLVPALTETLSYENTLFPALDAFSQSMEAIWNRNFNPVSDGLASEAIACLAKLLHKDFRSTYCLPEVRRKLQRASLLTGIAFSNTATAMAHVLSYPLTGKLGVPHGLACSFTLPEVLRYNAKEEGRTALVWHALGCESGAEAIDFLQGLFDQLELGRYLKRYIPGGSVLQNLNTSFVTSTRALNNIVPFTDAIAVEILSAAYHRLSS